jgi:glucoamylase
MIRVMGQFFLKQRAWVLAFLGLISAPLSALEAPRGTPWPATWASGTKEAYGTAYEAYDENGDYSPRSPTAPISRVWFTAAQGVTSEIFWPTLDRKQIRDMQFLVSDENGFFFEERTQSITQVSWVEKGVPAYRILTRDRGGHFEIEKILYTDPNRNTFLIKTRFRALKPGLHLYVLINPTLANTPYGDSARVDGQSLTAWQARDALALVSSAGFRKTSAGFSGSLDPYQDLMRDGRFDGNYDTATDGNVVMMGEILIPQTVGEHRFELALGFGNDVNEARDQARSSLDVADAALEQFSDQWRQYEKRFVAPQLSKAYSSDLFWGSIAVLKSLEDKTFPGAFIASPSVPWGLNKIDDSAGAAPRHTSMTPPELPASESAQGIGAYHLVWPRDLYQMAQSFLAIGDVESAKASLRYLQKIQYSDRDGFWEYGSRRFAKTGSFMQNAWLHGESYWEMLQIDQTSYPIILALQLWRQGAVSFEEIRTLVTTAADFVEANGPWTFQERWEENMGVAPSTLAVQIRALREASDAFAQNKDAVRAERFARKAAEWESRVEAWTFTTSGTRGSGNYYLRIVGTESPGAAWNPNSFAKMWITNGGPHILEKSVLDGGFLELIRHGVRSAWNSFVRSTIEVYDSELRSTTTLGAGFKRYSEDRYNWDEVSGQQTGGMIWPLLSGERGQYELASLRERARRLSPAGISSVYDSQVLSHLRAYEGFATPSGMFPEQVWDSGPRQGRPTGAATPLGWAHGEYLRFLRELEHFESRSLTPRSH